MSMEELIERCIKKDRPAWDEFVRRYQGLVRKAVRYKLSKAMINDLDDIVQEVFLTLWKDDKLSKIRDFSRLQGWLAVVTFNLTVSYSRLPYKRWRMTRSIHEKLSDGESKTVEDTIASRHTDPARSAELREAMSYIQDGITNLNAKERRALSLKAYDDKTQRDIARIMDIPANTAASLVRRAKIKIQEGIPKACLM